MSPVIAWSTALAALVWLADGVASRLRARGDRLDSKRPRSWLQGWANVHEALFAMLAAGALLLGPDDLDLGLASAPLQVLGLLLSIAALVLTLRARVELGDSFAGGHQVWTGQQLVTGGLFGLVRHPIYLGTIAIWIGVGLGALSWLLLVVGALVIAPTFYLLAREEERLMAEHFGTAYREYQRRVPMLSPWPRRGIPREGEAPAEPPSR